jgi:hypothetical protein
MATMHPMVVSLGIMQQSFLENASNSAVVAQLVGRTLVIRIAKIGPSQGRQLIIDSGYQWGLYAV